MIPGAGPWPGSLGAMDAGREKGKGVGWKRARKEGMGDTAFSILSKCFIFLLFHE